MKIKVNDIENLIFEEINRVDEGVFDALRGGSKELGRKIGSAAKDIKTAGQKSSLQADLNKLTQRAGQTIQMLSRQFEDLQGRAQALGLDNELQQIKTELNALDNYMRTAASNGGLNQSTNTEPEPSPLTQRKQHTSNGLNTTTEPESDEPTFEKPEVEPEPYPLTQRKQNGPDIGKKNFDIPQPGKGPSKTGAEFPKTLTPAQAAQPKKKDKGLTRDNIKQALSQTGDNAKKAAGLLSNQLGKIISDQDIVDFLMKESFLRKK